MVIDRRIRLCFLLIGMLTTGGCAGGEGALRVESDRPVERSGVVGVDGVSPDVSEAGEEVWTSGPPGWLVVEVISDGVVGGWATADFVSAANKIVIETFDVQQFAMHLDMISIDWRRRVVLRIDGSVFELTRKHYPLIRLRRSDMGVWNSVDGKVDS